jgi:hypothetical protein
MSPIVHLGHVIIALVVLLGQVARASSAIGVAPSQYWYWTSYLHGLPAIHVLRKVAAGLLTDKLGMAMTALGHLLASQLVLHHRMFEFYPHQAALLSGLSFPKAALPVILTTAHINAASRSKSISPQHGLSRACSTFLSIRKACLATAATPTLALIL